MFSALRKRMRFSPATVIAGLALVFAMTGGAYAAKKYLITSTKQISPSVLKSLQGKAGPAGANGAQGAAGPAGPQGAAGVGGAKGDAGAAGKDGSAGTAGPAGATGPKGETGLKGSNGAAGAAGATGPAGPTCPGGECLLPVGATETGVWSFDMTLNSHSVLNVSISFPLRLASAPTLTWVEPSLSGTPGAVTGCPGTVTEPKAETGKLCVYGVRTENVESPPFPPEEVLSTTGGMIIDFEYINDEPNSQKDSRGWGSWAVAR